MDQATTGDFPNTRCRRQEMPVHTVQFLVLWITVRCHFLVASCNIKVPPTHPAPHTDCILMLVVLDTNRWKASLRSCIACDMTENGKGSELVIRYRLKYDFVTFQDAERLTDLFLWVKTCSWKICKFHHQDVRNSGSNVTISCF
jgi:hypothetical protein